jgi:hypothetical protein
MPILGRAALRGYHEYPYLYGRKTMDSEIQDIIKRLEAQKAAIEKALAALQGLDIQVATVETTSANATPAAQSKHARQKPTKRKSNLSDEGRQRISDALKARWAATKAAAAGNGKKRGLKKVA